MKKTYFIKKLIKLWFIVILIFFKLQHIALFQIKLFLMSLTMFSKIFFDNVYFLKFILKD